MNSLLDDDEAGLDRKDRELTLGTGTILGIFLGLLLLCGLFFGFGYKVGSHKAAPAVEAATTNPSTASSTDFSGYKPAAGSPAARGRTGTDSDTNPDLRDDTSAQATPAEAAPIVRVDARRSARTSPSAASISEAAAASGTIFVQVAAVSHQEDAELLVNALRAKGYPVSARTQPKDQFYHIQVGPFDSLEAAGAAKQRLLADGYQPIIK